MNNKSTSACAVILGLALSGQANSAPVTLTYTGDFLSESVIVRNGVVGGQTAYGGGGGELRLPQFDPGLGTLVSVELVRIGAQESLREMHARRPLGGGEAFIQSSLVVGSGVEMSLLTSSAHVLPTALRDTFSFGSTHPFRSCSDRSVLGTASCEYSDNQSGTLTTNQKFFGEDLASFMGNGEIRFQGKDMRFSFDSVDGAPINLGDIIDFRLFELGVGSDIPGIEVGTKGLGLKVGLAAAALGIYFGSHANDGHGIFNRFADVHAASVYGFAADITYTYESAENGGRSVSEPGPLSLTGLGLAILAFGQFKRRSAS